MLKSSGYPGAPQIQHLLDLSKAERHRLHGSGRIEPLEAVTVNEFTTTRFDFEIGDMGVPTGGHLRVVWLWPFDWAQLQTTDPAADGYLRVSCSPTGTEVRVAYQFRGDLIPWNHQIDIEVVSGGLQRGDRVDLVCGCRQGGGGGWRAPTFTVPEAEFLLLINPDAGNSWWQLAPVQSFPLVASAPERLVALAPSEGTPGQELELTLRVEDAWGNPVLVEGAAPEASAATGCSLSPTHVAGNMPAYHCLARFDASGTFRLEFTVPGTDLRALTNPIRVTDESPQRRIFWGDLHAGQGEIGCGIGSVPQHFDFARHVAGLQFASHQANDHHVTLDMWTQIRQASDAAHEDGRFVAFLGCEWSAFTPAGGDRNVFYLHDEPRLRRSDRFFSEDVADPEADRKTATEFLQVMRHETVYINMHAGGRPTNLNVHEPKIEPLAEIHSTHGTSDWFVEDALRRGYRVGITAGTDGVAGRPGADHPGSRMIRNVRSGVTAFYATDLTREALWEAMGARRCYATSGERMLLHVDVDGHPMGSEYETTGEPLISLSVEGTAAIEQVDLLCGTELLWSWTVAPQKPDGALRLLWGGTESCGTARDQLVDWKGRLTVRDGWIDGVEPVGFIPPADHVELVDPHTLNITSVTAGNHMGVELDLAGDASTVCRFESGPVTFEFALNQVQQAPMTVAAGGLNRRVCVGPAPDADASCRAELSFRDNRAHVGDCPYWVRVTQVDQHRAWSSPVYVTRQAHSG
jgi:hypothetical protein